jgi:hypothetical protein
VTRQLRPTGNITGTRERDGAATRHRSPDIINDFIEKLLAADPNVSIRTADELRYELRLAYGGKRLYIAKLEPTDPRRKPWWGERKD